jgi:cell division protease FtsH
MATDMARRMVTEWGMSEKLGPLRYSGDQEEVFLGHSVAQSKTMSDETASLVDAEIRTIVESAYTRATKLLTDHLDQLHTLAKALLEYEMLSGDEIKGLLLRGEPIIRDKPEDLVDTGPRSSVPSSSGTDTPPGAEPQSV